MRRAVRRRPRGDRLVTYRPVTGVSPSRVGVAWPPANDTDAAVQDFVRCCLDNRP